MTGLSLTFLSVSELTRATVTSLLATVRTSPLDTPSLGNSVLHSHWWRASECCWRQVSYAIKKQARASKDLKGVFACTSLVLDGMRLCSNFSELSSRSSEETCLRFHLLLWAVSAMSDILTRTSRVKMSSYGGLKPCLQ